MAYRSGTNPGMICRECEEDELLADVVRAERQRVCEGKCRTCGEPLRADGGCQLCDEDRAKEIPFASGALFMILLLCLPACGQAAYSGHGLYSGSAGYGASVCGPGNAYGCFVSNTNVINYATPIPSWGPNTCDSTSMDTLSQCGNLTGAGVTITPSDFGNAMVRCTDVNTNGNPNTTWQTADEPSVNLWNSDDTAMLLLINGGSQFVFLWDGSHCAILTTSTGGNITFPAGTVWSYIRNNHIYSLDNVVGPGIYLQDKAVTLTQGSGAVSSTNLFDFTNSQCLMNTVNGYPSDPSYTGGSFPLNKWNGSLGVSKDETIFSQAFSLLGGQGSGYYMVRWTVGQSGCDLYNTLAGTVTHNGTLVGTIPDTEWGGAYGGKAPRFTIHDSNQPSTTYTTLASGAHNYVYGTYVDGIFFWGGGTNFSECGIGAPNWQAVTAYNDGDRVLPTGAGGVNAGGYLFQLINGVSGTSGATPPTSPTGWNQTPGTDTTDGPLTWRNIGIGTSTSPYFTYFCDGHTWKGFLGLGVGRNFVYHSFVNPQLPMLSLSPGASSAGDQHLGNTNANSSDTNWLWVTSTDVGTSTNLLTGPLPSALYMESFFVAPPYSSPGVQNCVYDAILCPSGTLGQVRRAFHCFGSGWHRSFDVQNCKCNVGAPNWNKSDSTDFVVGSKMFPNPRLVLNVGNYIYQVQSCSGTCTTGATMPAWVQNPTVAGVGTISDGTITWVAAADVNTPTNTAVQNCRADVMVIKLTR